MHEDKARSGAVRVVGGGWGSGEARFVGRAELLHDDRARGWCAQDVEGAAGGVDGEADGRPGGFAAQQWAGMALAGRGDRAATRAAQGGAGHLRLVGGGEVAFEGDRDVWRFTREGEVAGAAGSFEAGFDDLDADRPEGIGGAGGVGEFFGRGTVGAGEPEGVAGV